MDGEEHFLAPLLQSGSVRQPPETRRPKKRRSKNRHQRNLTSGPRLGKRCEILYQAIAKANQAHDQPYHLHSERVSLATSKQIANHQVPEYVPSTQTGQSSCSSLVNTMGLGQFPRCLRHLWTMILIGQMTRHTWKGIGHSMIASQLLLNDEIMKENRLTLSIRQNCRCSLPQYPTTR